MTTSPQPTPEAIEAAADWIEEQFGGTSREDVIASACELLAALPHLFSAPAIRAEVLAEAGDELEWRVVHPHPSNLEPGGETWTEREPEQQARSYQRSGFAIQSRPVGPWVDVANPTPAAKEAGL